MLWKITLSFFSWAFQVIPLECFPVIISLIPLSKTVTNPKLDFLLLDCKEHVTEDAKSESISDAADLALPPEMPILIDFHALKDILGPPMYEMEVTSSFVSVWVFCLFSLVVFFIAVGWIYAILTF